jgi:hypothetical protein
VSCLFSGRTYTVHHAHARCKDNVFIISVYIADRRHCVSSIFTCSYMFISCPTGRLLRSSRFCPLSVTANDSVHLLGRLARTRALDDPLDELLNGIPVACVDWNSVGLEILHNCLQLIPAVLVMDERQRNANTSETAGATDTVQVRLGVWVKAISHGGNVLQEVNTRSSGNANQQLT